MFDYFRRRKIKKLKNEFLELHGQILALEYEGCMRKPCTKCEHLRQIDEHKSTCIREECATRMLDIYYQLFPNGDSFVTWNERIDKVKNL